jgi:hypothetical protein
VNQPASGIQATVVETARLVIVIEILPFLPSFAIELLGVSQAREVVALVDQGVGAVGNIHPVVRMEMMEITVLQLLPSAIDQCVVAVYAHFNSPKILLRLC